MPEQQERVSKSSSSSISSSSQESEEEVTIGTLITEATNTTNSRKSLGRRLSHLDSIPVLFSLLSNMFFLIILRLCFLEVYLSDLPYILIAENFC